MNSDKLLILPIAPIWNWNVRYVTSIKCDLATNRTNLELKLADGSSIHGQGNYQSHQSGIETDTYSCIEGRGIHYQSHQSGIETFVCCPHAAKAVLPIAPIWNWNQTGRHNMPLRHSTNRTNLELKLRAIPAPIARAGSTNRTNLELKQILNSSGQPGLSTTNRTNLELKLISGTVKTLRPSSTNRTNLELKLRSYLTLSLHKFYQSHQSGIETQASHPVGVSRIRLPIAPIWNWNRMTFPRWWKLSLYQSHQSGIETQRLLQGSCLTPSTNRTNLELKLWSGPFSINNINYYQSHQSGIETFLLFRIRRIIIPYQSHQSGIET